MEAIDSVLMYEDRKAYEIIIVNDGSTDEYTLLLLKKLSGEGFTVLDQQNQGPAAARNSGVKQSKAPYILFLDSDNKIRAQYINRGIEILNTYNDVAVAYGNASFFGETDKPRFITRAFDKYSIFMGNYIDICSVVRKKAWQDVGGLDENRLLIGHEDWEFWIHLSSKDWKFHFINEVLFDYRIRDNSLLLQKSEENNLKEIMLYVYTKHWYLLLNSYRGLYANYRENRSSPVRSSLRNLYHKYLRRSNIN